MNSDKKNKSEIHKVVINHEEQYSVFPNDFDYPGWKAVGKTGTVKECMEYIREVWTDMRPVYIRMILDKREK